MLSLCPSGMVAKLFRDLFVSFLFVGVFFGASSLFAGKTHRSQPQIEQFIQGTKNEVVDVLRDNIRAQNISSIDAILHFLLKPKTDSVPDVLLDIHAIDEETDNYSTLCSICRQTEFQSELVKMIVTEPDVCRHTDTESIRKIIDHMPREQRIVLLSKLNDGSIEWVPAEIRYSQEEIQQLH